jgi:hypothetical protein
MGSRVVRDVPESRRGDAAATATLTKARTVLNRAVELSPGDADPATSTVERSRSS